MKRKLRQRFPKITEESLLEAAKKGSLEEVENLVTNGVDVNCKDKTGATPLTEAAGKGHLDIVEYLLNQGADVDGDKELNHSLSSAVEGGHLDVVQCLIQHGANIHNKNYIGDTPLHLSAKGDDLEMVKCLVQHGADIHCKNDVGDTPLHHAAEECGELEVFEYLIQQGAAIDGQNDQGRTPLVVAVINSNSVAVEYLLDQGADWTLAHVFDWLSLCGHGLTEEVKERLSELEASQDTAVPLVMK